MVAPTSALAAAWLLSATAHGATNKLTISPSPTDPALQTWVQVDESGSPTTITPSMTTENEETTVVSPPPMEITGIVKTIPYAHTTLTTTVRTAPWPGPTAGDHEGVFALCRNKDGLNSPWCFPKEDDHIFPDASYYFLWDTSYFEKSNSTIIVQAKFENQSSGQLETIFQSPEINSSWGVWPHRIDGKNITGFQEGGRALSLQLIETKKPSNKTETLVGPSILLTFPPGRKKQRPTRVPDGAELYIALPIIFGFIFLSLIGGCIWNRKTRRIGFGNVMSRARHRKMPWSKRVRAQRALDKERHADERIQLMQRDDGEELFDYDYPDHDNNDVMGKDHKRH